MDIFKIAIFITSGSNVTFLKHHDGGRKAVQRLIHVNKPNNMLSELCLMYLLNVTT